MDALDEGALAMGIRIRPGGDGRLWVEFRYTSERVDKIKSIPGKRWHPEVKVWSVPALPGMVERLRVLFAGERIEIAELDRLGRTDYGIGKLLAEQLRLEGYSTTTSRAYRPIAGGISGSSERTRPRLRRRISGDTCCT